MQSTDPGEMAVEGLQSENEVCIIIKDPPRKGHRIYKGHRLRYNYSKVYHSLQFPYIENLQGEDNLLYGTKRLNLNCPQGVLCSEVPLDV